MKSTLLLFTLLILPLQAAAFNLEVESSLYKVNPKGKYQRETGYDLWRGKKEGLLYRLLFEEEFKVKRGARFKLSVTSGTTKVPFNCFLTGSSKELFEGGLREFTVRELYFHKENFIFKNLDLTVGKQPFQIGNFIRDYLWGGKFTYRIKGVTLIWNQIAAYEGRYLLFGGKEEDDVDIFNFKVKKGGGSVGFYWLSDAKGEEPAEFKKGITVELKGRWGELTGTTQNGELSLFGKVKLEGLTLEAGYAGRDFTSYGFKEGVSGIGLVYRPTFRDLRFVKGSLPLAVLEGKWELYGLYLQNSKGEFIGKEIGITGERPLTKNLYLYAKVGLGSDGSYALFGGIGWRVGAVPGRSESYPLEVKNLLIIKGEYSDLSQKPYKTQSEYQDYALARHLGFWHVTYKLSLKGKEFKLKVSTGKDTKQDYLVWGNTADDFKYQKEHGKEWHLEEAWLGREDLRAGLVNLSLKGFVNESLTGIEAKVRKAKLSCLFETDKERAKYLTLKWEEERGGLFLNYRKGEGSTTTLGLYLGKGGIEGGVLLQRRGGKRGWGAYLRAKGELSRWKIRGEYRIYSKEFETFGLKEYFWNEGFIYRPGEENLRLLKVSTGREFKTGLKRIDRLKPRFNFFYLNLRSFSGRLIGQEGGIVLSVKPGSKCRLDLSGSIGNNNSYYEGIAFKVKW